MTEKKKRLLTGLQPSGTLHIGNYFGSLKPFLDMYEKYESFLLVVDYHALTTTRNPEILRTNINEVVKDYLAVGVNPKKALIFKQSDIAEHTELAWIFECLVTVPFLMQAHAYKDKTAKGLEATAGLFNYPMLMAADILLYDADVIPVGQDQRQHIEYAREAAVKFNNAYGDTFTRPKELILEGVGIVPGTDGEKMSKSYGNTIPLFADTSEIQNAVMGIVTDSEGNVPENVYTLHQLFRKEEELQELYAKHAGKYKTLKEELISDMDSFIAPMRERREAINDEDVKEVLLNGAQQAREFAHKKMEEVRKKIGVTL